MRILIATGVFPPDIGGPAQYAKNLYDEFERARHEVTVARYGIERRLPIVIRHVVFFIKAFTHLLNADYAIAMDTFSVGVPTVLAGKLLGRRVVVRIAGDYLWELYVEHTGKLITLSNFYADPPHLPLKERIVFFLTKQVIGKAHRLVFSTEWQRDMFTAAYAIPKEKTAIIENYFAPREEGEKPREKNYVWAVRPMKLKNGRLLYRAFTEAKEKHPGIILDDGRYPYDVLLDRIRSSYAVILPSISEVSPNLILDAIRFGKPFIMTRESGYAERFKSIGLLVDPFNEKDIAEKIAALADDSTYAEYSEKVRNFSFTHSYRDMASEYLKLLNRV